MKNKSKNVQISEKLFLDLVKYHLIESQKNDTELQENIKKELNNKLDTLVKRELYTKYKTADNADEREKARQEYLNKIGMNENFRW